jgi:hypothetical protein
MPDMALKCFSAGASLLAMIVNDNAGNLMPRGVLWFIASRLAPAMIAFSRTIESEPTETV